MTDKKRRIMFKFIDQFVKIICLKCLGYILKKKKRKVSWVLRVLNYWRHLEVGVVVVG